MNKIDEMKARANEKRMQIRNMHWSLDDELLNDIDWLIGQIERKDEALRFYADDKNYCWIEFKAEVMLDDGNRAREAL